MRCAKNPTPPQCNAAAAALLTGLGVFVLLGQSCLCCWSMDSAGQELLGAQPQGFLGAGLRKGQVQVSKERLCSSVSSGVLLPLHQRINNSHDFAATWQFAHHWEGLQSNSVMVKHPSFWAIA